MGGPIKKNKAFFFGDYQGTRKRLGNTVFGTLPTGNMRSGDFSQIRDARGNLIPIFDPATGDPNGGTLPKWPAYTAANDAHLEFGNEIRAGSRLFAEDLDFWVEIFETNE